jgi:hypothetical protein
MRLLRPRFTVRRLMIAVALFALSLSAIRSLAGVGRTYEQSQVVFVLALAGNPVEPGQSARDLEVLAGHVLSPAVLDQALDELKGDGPALASPDPRADLRKRLQVDSVMITRRGGARLRGLLIVRATARSPQLANQIANAVADAYCQLAPPDTVSGNRCGAFWSEPPPLDRPWKVGGASLLGLLVSSAMFVLPRGRTRRVTTERTGGRADSR